MIVFLTSGQEELFLFNCGKVGDMDGEDRG